jgi:hypothetical protein
MVVFDVFNEPELVQAADVGKSASLNSAVAAQGEDPVQAWMNGGTRLQSEGGTSFVGMETLYTTVRTYAPETPVIISGVGPNVTDPTDGSLWAFDLSPVVLGDRVAGTTTPVRITNGDGTVGTNVIYSSHPYWNGGPGQDCSPYPNVSDGDNSANVNNPNHEGDLTAWIQPVAEQYPVFFGEIGYACDVASQGNNAAEYNINWAEQYGVGWMDFTFERNFGTAMKPAWGILECDIKFCDTSQYSSYASAAYVPYANGTYTYTTSTSTTTLLN